MKARLMWALAVVWALSGLALAQSAPKQSRDGPSETEKFVGAWRLAWIEEPGPDGTITRITDRKGMLMYTRDGRMSVQIQFPESQPSVSNDYVLNGYEASFGTFEVDAEAQTITRNVEGSITRGLVGRRLTRAYRFSDGRLTMRSVRPEERWSTTWERHKPQAKAPLTQPFGAEAFEASDGTTLRWLGMAGFLINSRGTTLMVDPLLEGFDMPIMITFPIAARDVPRLDAVLVTHSDNDHYSVPTNKALAPVTRAFHSTRYVDSLMKRDGLPSFGHDIGDVFNVGPVRVTVTPADHAWQNSYPGASPRRFKDEDSAGFWIETPDGTIWAPGDSRLVPEHHLRMPAPDALLFDFSDSEWHFGLAGAVRMANAYPDTPLLLHHWGTVDAPDFSPFNGDPQTLHKLVMNPGRIHVLAPGERFTLKRLKKP